MHYRTLCLAHGCAVSDGWRGVGLRAVGASRLRVLSPPRSLTLARPYTMPAVGMQAANELRAVGAVAPAGATAPALADARTALHP